MTFGATILAARDINTDGRIRRTLLNSERWPGFPNEGRSASAGPFWYVDPAAFGDSSGSLSGADYTVTIEGGAVFFTDARGRRSAGLHGSVTRAARLDYGLWKACGRPAMLYPINGDFNPTVKFAGYPPATVRALTAGAFVGFVQGEGLYTLSDLKATLDGVTPQLWAVENDRTIAMIDGGRWTTAFNVLAVV